MSQSARGSRNVQIQDVANSLIQISFDGGTQTVPLEPALVPPAQRVLSPARLVRAHAGVFPYVDRGGLLGELRSWLDLPAPFAGFVIGGRGGSGKTRLAVELCEHLRGRGWLSGFLSRISDQSMLDGLVQAPLGRLVVVDYAEARVEQLQFLLPLLQTNATPENPVRVLLLVRAGPAQAKGWPAQLRNQVDALDTVLDECEARILEETPLESSDRAELFRLAADAFISRMDPRPPEPAAPDLDKEVFASPLMVVIAAYLSAYGDGVPPASRAELLDEVLAHEHRYWQQNSAGLESDDVLRERVVALATLVRADSEAGAADLLRLLPDLADAPLERRNRLARWVRDQYPGPGWWNPLEPDLVGEHLVARCFSGHADVLRGALASSDPDAITRPLEVLARAAADHPELEAALEPVLSEALGHLCGIAVRQAEQARDKDLLYGNAVTAARAIAAALSTVEVHPRALFAALDLMPTRPNVVLNELALTLSRKEVERCRSAGVPKPLLAAALNNLASRLAEGGRREEALEVIEAAVRTFRSLFEAEPESHQAGLAMSLNNLSNCLSEVGRRKEALEPGEEAIRLRRPLSEVDPDAHKADLAMALNNVSGRLAEAGRLDDALGAIEEAVELYESLAADEPEIYEADLAMALGNLGNHLVRTGEPEEALNATEHAVERYRRLAESDPAAHEHELAMALSNLAGCLAGVDSERGLEVVEEAVQRFRLLAEANPAAYESDLAMALNNLSFHRAALGEHEKALIAIQESVMRYLPLAKANPAAYGASMILSLRNLYKRLLEMGREDEAEAIRRNWKEAGVDLA